MYPIARAMLNGLKEIYAILNEVSRKALSDILNTHRFGEWLYGSRRVGAFRRAVFKGDILIKSKSAIVLSPSVLRIVYENGTRILNLTENEKLSLFGFRHVLLRGKYVEIMAGKGFYNNISVSDGIIYFGESDAASLAALEGRNVSLIWRRVKYIEVLRGSLLVRTPTVSAVGESRFNDMYAYRELNKYIAALGHNCYIRGSLSFTCLFGDIYTIVKDLRFSGNATVQRVFYKYDEARLFIQLIPYITLVLLGMTIMAIEQRVKSQRKPGKLYSH